MKLNQDQDYATVVGEVNKNEVGVSTNNAKKTIMLLTSKLYSEPINSFIREISSNAWDSHVEAGVDEPIILSIEKDPLDRNFIKVSFRDFGVGLSPERFNTVYRFLGETTKEDSNDFIGAYGLGKFSPLSVVDMVPITSFYNGVRYSYLMYKNGMGINIDLVDSTDTDERNGLLVEVKVESSKYFNVLNGIKKQLRFFENIYIKDTYGTTGGKSINESKIKHYNSFSVSTLERGSGGLTILNGKVEYDFVGDTINDVVPANLKKLVEMLEDCDVAMRFEIGELDLVPSRESLHYTEKTIKAICDRLEDIRDELIDLKLKQLNNGVITPEHLISLKLPGILTLDNLFDIDIYELPIVVDFEELRVEYKTLYQSIDEMMSLGLNYLSTWRLEGGRITLNKGYPFSINCYLKRDIFNFNPDKHTTIEKKYIRSTTSKFTLFRDDWAEVADKEKLKEKILEEAARKKVYMTEVKLKLVYIISEMMEKRFKSVTKMDLRGITPEFIESCKPKKRVSVNISCLVVYGRKKERHSYSIEEISQHIKTIVVTGVDSVLTTPYEEKNVVVFKVSKTNIPKLLKLSNTISEEEYVKQIKDKIVYENEIQHCLNYLPSDLRSKLMRAEKYVEVPQEVKDLNYFRYNQDKLTLAPLQNLLTTKIDFNRIKSTMEESAKAGEILSAFNLENTTGIQWAKEKLKEEGFKLIK